MDFNIKKSIFLHSIDDTGIVNILLLLSNALKTTFYTSLLIKHLLLAGFFFIKFNY